MYRRITLSSLTLLLVASSLCAQQPLDVFAGNRIFSDKRLLGYLTDNLSGVDLFSLYKPENAERAAQGLRKFYQDKGFPLVKVDVYRERKKVGFHILEGPKASVGSVQFRGNHLFPDEKLHQLASLKGHLNSGRVEKALATISQAYRDEGYVRVEVGPVSKEVVEIEHSDHFPVPFRRTSSNRVDLVIPVKEGAHFSYGAVDLPPELSVLGLSPPVKGEPYRERDLLEFRRRIQNHFIHSGKLIKKLGLYQNIRDDSHQVDVRVRYELLPELVVGKIEFRGNNRYPDFFYRREMRIQEQHLLVAQDLQESLNNLKETGVLTSYEVEFDLREAEGEVDVIIDLEEKKRQKVFYSFGSDGTGGTASSVIYSVFNLLGLGEQLGLDVSLGSQSTTLATSFLTRYLPGGTLPMSLALRFFRRHTSFKIPDADESIRDLLRVNRIGLSAGTSYRIRPHQEAGITVSGERVSSAVDSTSFSLRPFWVKSKFKDGIPTESLRVSDRFSFFSGPLDSWNLRPSVDYRRYFPGARPESPTLAFRVNGSYARFFGRTAPVTERLFTDPYGVRGFHGVPSGPWGRFGDRVSPVGGDTLLTFNTEYRVPLNDTFSVAPFFDTGFNMALTRPEGYDLVSETRRIWRASLGGELKMGLPKGMPPVRLIFAWNPLRMDRLLATPKGWARLRDPAKAIRFSLGPSF